MPLKDKIACISREIYGAGEVQFSPIAEERLASYTRAGYDALPICMAKTQYSLSTDASVKGAPTGHSVLVRDVRAAVGAGYVYPLAGDIMTIPGLPTRPGFYDVDYDFEKDRTVGLF